MLQRNAARRQRGPLKLQMRSKTLPADTATCFIHRPKRDSDTTPR